MNRIHLQISEKRFIIIMDIAMRQLYRPSQSFDFIDAVGVESSNMLLL